MTYEPAKHLCLRPADRWLFRWGFEFLHKAAAIGPWGPAHRPEDMAAAVNKTGLMRAYIEGKHWTSREVKRFAECPGPDFINFEHLAVLLVNSGRTHHYGMRIQTRYEVITCLEDGSVTHERRQLEDNYLYPEWTRV